jgi:hypothetical protein
MADPIEPVVDESTVHVAEPEVTQTAPPPAATETATEQMTQPSWSFLDAAREAGYNVDQFQSDAEAARAFFNYTRSLQSPPEPPAPEPEPPKEEEWTLDGHFDKLWGVPKYDPAWDDLLTVGASGQIEAKAHVPWGAAQQALEGYARWQSSRQKAVKDLFDSGNPYQRMYEALKPAFEREFAKPDTIQQEFTTRQESAFIDSFEARHSQWLTSVDGQRFVNYAEELAKQDGLPPVRALEIAARAFRPIPNGTQQTQQIQPTQPTEPQPKPATSFVDDALSKAGHRPGGTASATPAPSQGALSAEEVRNLFKQDFAKSQAAT